MNTKSNLIVVALGWILACSAETNLGSPGVGGSGAGAGGSTASPTAVCRRATGPAPFEADKPCEGNQCEVCPAGDVCAFIGEAEPGSSNWVCCTPDPADLTRCCAPPVYPECQGGIGGFPVAAGRECNYAYGPESTAPLADYSGHTTCHGEEICGFTGLLWNCCSPGDASCCADPCDEACPFYDRARCVRCSTKGSVASPNDPACDDGICSACNDNGAAFCGWSVDSNRYHCCAPDPGQGSVCCSAPGAADCMD